MDLVTVAALASIGYGMLAWWRYERSWDPREGWFGRRFWLSCVLPVVLFCVAAFVMALMAQPPT